MTRHRKTDVTASKTDEVQGSGPAKKSEVKITPAKGRPMLTWVGKRPLSYVTAFPAQHVETFGSVGAGLALPRAQQAAPLRDTTIWRDWPTAYPKLTSSRLSAKQPGGFRRNGIQLIRRSHGRRSLGCATRSCTIT